MKGIILAGGSGSRLYPLTQVASKQLQPVYDKPMVYYPLTVLIASGIREFCLISTPQDIPRYQQLLGDGKRWGITIEYREQVKPEGIAQAFLIAESFIGSDPVTLILGDNIFFGGDAFPRAFAEFKSGATVFAYHVIDPERYGVVEFGFDGKALSIEEKPEHPRSNYAVPGVYIYDNEVLAITRALKPSPRVSWRSPTSIANISAVAPCTSSVSAAAPHGSMRARARVFTMPPLMCRRLKNARASSSAVLRRRRCIAASSAWMNLKAWSLPCQSANTAST
jgi:glucose-1-phosphate thymidylyltransferase short form